MTPEGRIPRVYTRPAPNEWPPCGTSARIIRTGSSHCMSVGLAPRGQRGGEYGLELLQWVHRDGLWQRAGRMWLPIDDSDELIGAIRHATNADSIGTDDGGGTW